jgi:arylsulfatase A
VCTPSRVQLLTGQYPFRTGWDVGEWDRPASGRLVDPGLPSVARVLRDAGYATAVAGKWQLARFHERPNHAAEFGFDEHCLWTYKFEEKLGTNHPRFWKPSIWQNGRLREDVAEDSVYGPDVFADFLIDFIACYRHRPFFACYPMVLTHRPYVATPDTVADRSATRADAAEKREDHLARFAANVAYMDKLVGRLLAALDQLELRRRTVVIFTADNGADQRIVTKVGQREVAGGKTELNDRGASVPLIINWPGRTPAGRVCADLIDFTDILPTLTELAGADLPAGVMLDGRSFAPQARGEPGSPREWVYVQVYGKYFVRDHNWRLHDDGTLYDVRDRFEEKLIDAPEVSTDSEAARRRLAGVIDQLRSQRAARGAP